MTHVPPFDITPAILRLVQEIYLELGKISGSKSDSAPILLRRKNRIRTIQASLAIEGNTISEDQISALLEGKRVIAPKQEILEVKNAIALYEKISKWDPLSIDHFLKAHQMLMKGLISTSGKFRLKGVGICKGEQIMHMAPPAKNIPGLVKSLFSFLSSDQSFSWLIKAAVFHYEIEFIHPFADGNGRMGRLWQQLLLMKENAIFQYLPVETMIRDHQEDYYSVLGICDKEGKSTKFIEFCLNQILLALKEFAGQSSAVRKDALSRLAYAREKLTKEFSRKEYLSIQGDISTATASRDLKLGVDKGILSVTGTINQARYTWLKAT